MPGRDGAGPKGRRIGAGRGQGRYSDRGQGDSDRGQGNAGRGRGGGFGAGPGGFCLCPSCGERSPHQPGSPCYDQKCPKCGTAMTRER
jgi:hypothetical protein